MNILKTAVLFTLLTLLLIWVGRVVAGTQGMLVAFCFALILNVVSYWYSDKIVLAMYRAKEIGYSQNPKIFNIVKKLTEQANLPMPKLYVIPAQTPNAFATGRNPHHAAIAVTEGILSLLNEDELEGVLAHELAHVKNRDILISSVVATVAGAIFLLANIARYSAIFGGVGGRRRDSNVIGLLIVSIVAPISAMLIQLAISRAGEFRADRKGALLSKKPLSLASALEKLHFLSQRKPLSSNPTTAHLFIVNPLSGKGIAALFSTHPSVGTRIEKLKQIAKEI
ncbi:MAG: zinc metalloprotease HtpX [Candidatus Omnitrophota bacterium]